MRRSTLGNLLIVSTLLVACGGRDAPGIPADEATTTTDVNSCLYKGMVYQDQEEFSDGCNDCKCNPEGSTGVGCTMKNGDGLPVAPTPDPTPVSTPAVEERTCTYKGEVYQDQEEFTDDCNGCKCNPAGETGVGCTKKKCAVARVCQSNDACPAGSSCKPQYDIGVDPWDECETVGQASTLCHVGDHDDCAEGYYCADAAGLDDIEFGIGRCTASSP